MKRVIALASAAVFLAVVLGGCSIENIDKKKIKDLEYTVVPEENIPAEIYENIVKQYDEFCRSAYICSDMLYIVVCYGAQPTEGYTIEVDCLYESSNAIICETTLKGPSRQEKVEEKVSYPYIVLRLEKSEKMVAFN
ncbi:MAG: protease complex subunit PrcB family protein [Lachnospiraceae bacterium]|nr:protease complex subunit PrcB family protein [Lachnospiraceae bacterium]